MFLLLCHCCVCVVCFRCSFAAVVFVFLFDLIRLVCSLLFVLLLPSLTSSCSRLACQAIFSRAVECLGTIPGGLMAVSQDSRTDMVLLLQPGALSLTIRHSPSVAVRHDFLLQPGTLSFVIRHSVVFCCRPRARQPDRYRQTERGGRGRRNSVAISAQCIPGGRPATNCGWKPASVCDWIGGGIM